VSWGVWCARTGGAWLREDGEEWTAVTEEEAVVKAQETSLSAYETLVMAGRENPLTYRARLYDGRAAKREIYETLRTRRETDG